MFWWKAVPRPMHDPIAELAAAFFLIHELPRQFMLRILNA